MEYKLVPYIADVKGEILVNEPHLHISEIFGTHIGQVNIHQFAMMDPSLFIDFHVTHKKYTGVMPLSTVYFFIKK